MENTCLSFVHTIEGLGDVTFHCPNIPAGMPVDWDHMGDPIEHMILEGMLKNYKWPVGTTEYHVTMAGTADTGMLPIIDTHPGQAGYEIKFDDAWETIRKHKTEASATTDELLHALSGDRMSGPDGFSDWYRSDPSRRGFSALDADDMPEGLKELIGLMAMSSAGRSRRNPFGSSDSFSRRHSSSAFEPSMLTSHDLRTITSTFEGLLEVNNIEQKAEFRKIMRKEVERNNIEQRFFRFTWKALGLVILLVLLVLSCVVWLAKWLFRNVVMNVVYAVRWVPYFVWGFFDETGGICYSMEMNHLMNSPEVGAFARMDVEDFFDFTLPDWFCDHIANPVSRFFGAIGGFFQPVGSFFKAMPDRIKAIHITLPIKNK